MTRDRQGSPELIRAENEQRVKSVFSKAKQLYELGWKLKSRRLSEPGGLWSYASLLTRNDRLIFADHKTDGSIVKPVGIWFYNHNNTQILACHVWARSRRGLHLITHAATLSMQNDKWLSNNCPVKTPPEPSVNDPQAAIAITESAVKRLGELLRSR